MDLRRQEELYIIKRGVVDFLPDQDALEAKLRRSHEEGKPLRVKLGIDPTGPSIHLGHAVPLQKLRQFQELGHHTILIIGTFTGTVGDPEGRKVTRPHLSREQVLQNAEAMYEQICKIIDPLKTEVVHNADWLDKMSCWDGFQLASKVTIAQLLARHDFGMRFRDGVPIHLHEVVYPLLMGHDSVHLESDIEIGATEQTLNIYMGRHLQELAGQEPQVGIIMPVLEGLDGVEKMSKSLGNYIGLDESPRTVFEKVTSIPDRQIIPYFTLLTCVPMSDIDRHRQGLADGLLSSENAKNLLALEIVRAYLGEEAVKTVAAWARDHPER